MHDELAQQAWFRFDAATGVGEVNSWRNSLPAFLRDLQDAGLGDVEVLLEHQLPLTASGSTRAVRRAPADRTAVVRRRRAEAVDRTPSGSTTTWSHVAAYGAAACCTRSSRCAATASTSSTSRRARRLHGAWTGSPTCTTPPPRAWRLRQLPDRRARPAVHRATSAGRCRTSCTALLDTDPATADRGAAGGRRTAERRVTGRRSSCSRSPRRRCAPRAVRAARRAAGGVHAWSCTRWSRPGGENTKKVVIVLGGPGTGKSVHRAVPARRAVAGRAGRVLHATGSQSFTQTLRKVAGSRSAQVQDCSSTSTVHRRRAEQARRADLRRGAPHPRDLRQPLHPADLRAPARPQVDELIDVARVPVFLLDEHQVVRPGEMGTVARDPRSGRGAAGDRLSRSSSWTASSAAAAVDAYERGCCGCSGLGAAAGPSSWERRRPHASCRVADRPEELEALLDAPDPGSAATAPGWPRATAGPGRSETSRPGGPLVDDVVIGDWRRPWNPSAETRGPRRARRPHFWASDPRGFGQVGCIYTAQGFEYDWSGVIFGADLVWRGRPLGRAPRAPSKDPVEAGHRTRTWTGAGPQHLQGAADPRHEGDGRVLDRSGDAGVPRGDVPVADTGTRRSPRRQSVTNSHRLHGNAQRTGAAQAQRPGNRVYRSRSPQVRHQNW